MPIYARYKTDVTRRGVIEQTYLQSQIADGFVAQLFTTELREKITQLAPQFTATLDAAKKSLEDRKRQVATCDQVLAKLRLELQICWSSLVTRTLSDNLNPEVHTFYGLTKEGYRPSQKHKWIDLEFAQTILDGEAQAVAKNYPPLPAERLSSLQTVLNSAIAEQQAFEVLLNKRVSTQQTLAQQRLQVDQYIRKLIMHLRYRLSDEPTAKRREILRRFGFVFYNSATGQPEPSLPTDSADAVSQNTTDEPENGAAAQGS